MRSCPVEASTFVAPLLLVVIKREKRRESRLVMYCARKSSWLLVETFQSKTDNSEEEEIQVEESKRETKTSAT